MQFRLVELRLIDLARGLLARLHPMIQLIEMVPRFSRESSCTFHRRYDPK